MIHLTQAIPITQTSLNEKVFLRCNTTFVAVDSGEGTWRTFLEHDLWDGIDMLVHPLVIGNGKPLFASMPIKVSLRLVESKTYDNGVVNLRYQRI